MFVKYKGRSDVRELAAEDLRKAGVEGFRKTSFLRNESTEVPDEVGRALIEHELFARDFEQVDEVISQLDAGPIGVPINVEPRAEDGEAQAAENAEGLETDKTTTERKAKKA